MDFIKKLISTFVTPPQYPPTALGRLLNNIEKNSWWRFQSEVTSALEAHKFRKSDLPVLERGLRDPNPDIVLTCACIYGEHGPDLELLKQSLIGVVYSDRTRLGQAALGQLSRMELTGADGKRLIEFIAPYVYEGIPAELFGALAAVDGPTDEILEEVFKRWKTLQQNFFSPSYQLAAQRSFVMEKVWELCLRCQPGPVRDFLRREAILWNYKLWERLKIE